MIAMIRFWSIVLFSILTCGWTAPIEEEANDEDIVIFEKAADPVEGPNVQPDGTNGACIEEHQVPNGKGGQCLDLLEALHNLMIDDMPGIRLEIDPVMRKKRDIEDESIFDQLGAVLAFVLDDAITNSTNSSIDFFDFPIVDEGPIFVNSVHQHTRDNGSKLEEILVPMAVAQIEDWIHSNHTDQSQLKFENATARPVINQSLIWEISSALTQLSMIANFSRENASDLDAIARVEAVLAKVMPLVIRINAVKNIRLAKNGTDGAVNNSKGFDTVQAPDPAHLHRQRALPPTMITATEKLITPDTASRTSTSNRIPVHPETPVIGTIPISPEIDPPQNWTEPGAQGIISGNAGHPNAIGVQSTIEQTLAKNSSAEAYLKEKLMQRAPYFLPKEQTTLWKAEKRRQQACVLLSSIDSIRQKCCLSLRLTCPEFASAIQVQQQRMTGDALSGKDDNRDAIFERPDKKGLVDKRGRRNEPINANKNALIADTLARISNLLSILLRGEGENV